MFRISKTIIPESSVPPGSWWDSPCFFQKLLKFDKCAEFDLTLQSSCCLPTAMVTQCIQFFFFLKSPGPSFIRSPAGCLKRKSWRQNYVTSLWEEVKPLLASYRIFHISTSSQSQSPHSIPVGSGKGKNALREQMKRKERRNEWRGEGRERAEGKSVTRLFLVVLVMTGGEKCWNILLLLSSPLLLFAPILTSSFSPKTSSKPPLNPNITIGTKAVCSQNIRSKICEIPLKPGKTICGGNWGNNQDSQSHEWFILVVTDIGQEMFFKEGGLRECVCVWTEGNCNFASKSQHWHRFSRPYLLMF